MASPMDNEELTRLIMTNNQWIHSLLLDLEHLSIEKQQLQLECDHEHQRLFPGQFTQNQIRRSFEKAVHASQCESPNCDLRCHVCKQTLVAMTHASQCPKVICEDQNCFKIKGVYRHGIMCKKLPEERCHLCRVLWHCLMVHARVCTDSICGVPCCRGLEATATGKRG
ncbi:hypothetical protein OROMI_022795 [Orobanche minor]